MWFPRSLNVISPQLISPPSSSGRYFCTGVSGSTPLFKSTRSDRTFDTEPIRYCESLPTSCVPFSFFGERWWNSQRGTPGSSCEMETTPREKELFSTGKPALISPSTAFWRASVRSESAEVKVSDLVRSVGLGTTGPLERQSRAAKADPARAARIDVRSDMSIKN